MLLVLGGNAWIRAMPNRQYARYDLLAGEEIDVGWMNTKEYILIALDRRIEVDVQFEWLMSDGPNCRMPAASAIGKTTFVAPAICQHRLPLPHVRRDYALFDICAYAHQLSCQDYVRCEITLPLTRAKLAADLSRDFSSSKQSK